MYPSRSRTSQLLPQCHHTRNALGQSRLLKRSPGPDTAVPIAPDTAHGISVLRAMLRSESEGDRASSRIQVRYCEFDLAFNRLEQHRAGAENRSSQPMPRVVDD